MQFYSSVLFSSLGSGHNSALLSTVIVGSGKALRWPAYYMLAPVKSILARDMLLALA